MTRFIVRRKDMINPIGIFDSGFGGLTVMKEIIRILPNEDIIYFGDTAHLPYGSKSKEAIKKFSLDIAKFLYKNKIKILVVACNTASSFALDYLKENLDIPVIGVVSPGVKAACKNTKVSRIGVIGTKGTINSNAYQNGLLKIDKTLKVFACACPLFVPLVEEGLTNSKITKDIVEMYLKSLKNKKIDTLILGCTHYPLLKQVIGKVIGKNVSVVDSAKETAKTVLSILVTNNIKTTSNKRPSYKFYVSDDPSNFKKWGMKFLGKDIKSVEKINLE
jgi:glutamate racemase